MGYIFNGINKTITLTSGTTILGVKDVYSRWKEWVQDSDNAKFLKAFDSVGGEDIDPTAGTKIPPYIFLKNGWRIKPQESNHTLNVVDGVLIVDGGGDPFLNTSGSYVVRVNYQQPVQAITVATGGGSGGLNLSQEAKLNEIWKMLNLDPNDPMKISRTYIKSTSEDINVDITGDDNENTFTRQ